MCGITGWVDFDRDLRAERSAVEAMTATMTCRGPDAEGVWCGARAGIGHRRLSVIDIEGGAQPMRAPGNQDVVLTFSGEIYNFPELRHELQAHGQVFRLHAAAEVQTRHTALPLADCGVLQGAEAVNDRYIDEATALGERALRRALDAARMAPADLDLLIVTSVTGVAVPSLDARLIPRLGLRRDIKRLPIFGLGCVAGAAALGRLNDYLLGWPGQTAALLAVELCSLNWPTSGITPADMVAAGLFGDGAVALIACGGQADPVPGRGPGPRVIASRSAVYPDSDDALGWRLSTDCFRIVLTTELPAVVERGLADSVTGFLAEHDLTIHDIASWICHPGGPKVIDAVQRALKLPDQAVAASRRSLAEVGNMSSASVLHILEMISDTERPPAGSAGLMIGLGPGVSAELVLLRW